MKAIWKYVLAPTDQQTIEMPKGAVIICIQVQSEVPCLWALVDPALEKENRVFATRGTGHKHPDEQWTNLQYIGSYQLGIAGPGSFVGHVFELKQMVCAQFAERERAKTEWLRTHSALVVFGEGRQICEGCVHYEERELCKSTHLWVDNTRPNLSYGVLACFYYEARGG